MGFEGQSIAAVGVCPAVPDKADLATRTLGDDYRWSWIAVGGGDRWWSRGGLGLMVTTPRIRLPRSHDGRRRCGTVARLRARPWPVPAAQTGRLQASRDAREPPAGLLRRPCRPWGGPRLDLGCGVGDDSEGDRCSSGAPWMRLPDTRDVERRGNATARRAPTGARAPAPGARLPAARGRRTAGRTADGSHLIAK